MLHIWRAAQGPGRASLLTQPYMTREITAAEWVPACTRTQCTHPHLFCALCKHGNTLNHLLPLSSAPSWHFSLFIYNQENKAVLWLCFDLWQFLQFLLLNYWPLRERDRKLQKRGSDPPSQWRFNSFSIFSTPSERQRPLERPTRRNGGVMIRFTMRERVCVCVCACVCCVPPLPLRTPFRLLSPHQPTHTWLRLLGHTLLRIDVFIAPKAYVR